MNWLKSLISELKIKCAIRWISKVPNLKIVRIERRGKTDYLVSTDGQFWRLGK